LSRLFTVKSDWLLGLTSDSGLDSLSKVVEARNRDKILRQLEKEAEFSRRVWGR